MIHFLLNGCSTIQTKFVCLLQPYNEPLIESNYRGFAMFNGIDAFVWLTKMNVQGGSELDPLIQHRLGKELFLYNKLLRFPLKLSTNPDDLYDDSEPTSYAKKTAKEMPYVYT
ncbi:hypothetical protein [Photobacterium leiognathi]|uniref:hypothetical protein n=1 Tax=Photobacterium leiognathi TaxID=553611 RepID=UPI0029819D7C|nr:hypothetical protein [Photobacterium leiognathi]